MSAAAVLVLCAAGASSAAAASPWWGLTSAARPTHLVPGSTTAVVVATAANVGNADASGPVTITDRLPEGLVPSSSKVAFRARTVSIGGQENLAKAPYVPLHLCTVTGREVSCTYRDAEELEALGFSSTLVSEFQPLRPYMGRLEMRITVKVEASPGQLQNEVAVSGGGGPANSIHAPLRVSEEAAPFGVEEFQFRLEEEGGAAATQAASHPYQLTNVLDFNQTAEESKEEEVEPVQQPRNLSFRLPPGMLGNVTALPKCTAAQFSTQDLSLEEVGISCPPATQIGVATVTYFLSPSPHMISEVVPVFNLVPEYGEPARFGFLGGVFPITLDTSLRSGNDEDYGVTVSTTNITELASVLASEVTFWGVPGDPSHDISRGYQCLHASPGCTLTSEPQPKAFLTLPASCPANPLTEPFAVSLTARSWLEPPSGNPEAISALRKPNGEALGIDGCNELPFKPEVQAEPTSNAATTGTGLNFNLDFRNEGLTNANPGAVAESEVKKAIVTLPEGFTTNPSVAEGLRACSQSEYESATISPGSGCTEESKIGSLEVESPLVEQKLTGSLYVARQKENPFGSLLALYMVFRNPELGIFVKAAGKVESNYETGQIITTFDNLPQLPFSHFHLSFRSGQRSPLITPPACGTYSVQADFFPWSNPSRAVEIESPFQITQGPEGQGCPNGGLPPFHPNLEAGTLNNAAGSYSPFYTHITRKDSEQEITHFSIKLPPGLSGKLAGVAKCSDAAIAAAKSREHELGGQEELEHPSCPANSEVGHTLVGTGVGNVLAYAPGKLYLAGPYKGAQISIVSITAAKVGPFDLGTVVIREGLKVNPETAQVSVDAAGSDPIPHIVDGIPVHLRDIRIYVDRPNFTINPTSCQKMSTAATVLGSGLDFASEADDQPVTVTSPFQAADCASLGFKPKLALKLKGKTRRGGLPKLTATVTYPKQGAYANIAKTVVTLPPSEFLEQGHIGSSCTRVQFNSGAGNGAGCPKKSILGHARAITPLLDEPVEGLVYLRSNGGERRLPDLVAALHSEDININLVGFISSRHKKGSEVSQIQNTFAAVPDAPVSKFTLELFGGKKGLLVNSTNICKGTHKAISEFTGQNGKLYDTEPKVAAQCGKKGKKHKKKHNSHAKKASKRVGTSHR